MHIVYKTTNLKNGKIYIGAHCRDSDDYLGSGKYLHRAIKKHGIENFQREILARFDKAEDAFEFERELVTEEFCAREDTYNLAPGGSGGSIALNRGGFHRKHTEETKLKISKSRSGFKASDSAKENLRKNSWARKDPEAQRAHAKRISKGNSNPKTEEHKNSISESLKKFFDEHGSPNKGKPKVKVECPHCMKQGASHVMARWHFQNCKSIAGLSSGDDKWL